MLPIAQQGQSRGPMRQVRPPIGLPMNKVRLAVHASDPLSQAGIHSHVGRRPDIELLPASRLADADVLVVIATMMGAQVVEGLRRLIGTGRKPRVIMILDRLGDADLPSAIEIGVTAVLWRSEASAERLLQAVLTVSRGGSEMPTEVQGKLVADMARLQRTVLAPRGLTASGLDSREIDVLRLIAAGLDTGEIAQQMLYSERTVKGILYGLMSRLSLRNRSHAVAYAIRAGIL
jgi:DNA-binding NarL/FixJ family response regulator